MLSNKRCYVNKSFYLNRLLIEYSLKHLEVMNPQVSKLSGSTCISMLKRIFLSIDGTSGKRPKLYCTAWLEKEN